MSHRFCWTRCGIFPKLAVHADLRARGSRGDRWAYPLSRGRRRDVDAHAVVTRSRGMVGLARCAGSGQGHELPRGLAGVGAAPLDRVAAGPAGGLWASAPAQRACPCPGRTDRDDAGGLAAGRVGPRRHRGGLARVAAADGAPSLGRRSAVRSTVAVSGAQPGRMAGGLELQCAGRGCRRSSTTAAF